MNKFANGVTFNSLLLDISPSFYYISRLIRRKFIERLYVTLHIFTSFDKAFYKVSSKLLPFQRVFCITFKGVSSYWIKISKQEQYRSGNFKLNN